MKAITLIVCLFAFAARANYLEENLKKDNWGGVEIVWLVDESYPVYDISVYFHGGAYTDSPGKYGETSLAFDLLTTGTTRYKQSEILDTLEFYGASYQANVTHEFTSYNVSGLAKDAVPTMKMVCHMFKNATYPRTELKKSVKRIRTGLRNLPSNHGALADRVFRKVTLSGTGYQHPVGGTLGSLSKISSKDLKQKLEFFNNSVKKRIYIKGPKEMSELKRVFERDCGWGEVVNKVDTPKVSSKKRKGSSKTVYLVPVAQANQAQIRIGNYMSADEVSGDHELRRFTSQYIGGGFTSRLMQTVRVEKGLTYSIGSYASEQREYGRKGISTFTKNETLPQTLEAIAKVIRKNSSSIGDEAFEMAKRQAKGSYLFGLESTSAFLSNMIYYDHIGRDYEEIYKFPKVVDGLGKGQVKTKVSELFNPDGQVILVVGSKDLKKPLEKAGYRVKLLDYKKYL